MTAFAGTRMRREGGHVPNPRAVDPEVLEDDLVRAGAGRRDASVVAAALQLVTVLTRAMVSGADGASVTLRQGGGVRTVASTDPTIRRMDAHQYATGEGPCLAAAAEGRSFHIRSLAAEMRWPDFVPRARGEGIASILSTPLTALGEPIGALNIYSSTAEAFDTPQQELAGVLAQHASGLLADSRGRMTDAEMAPRIHEALLAREVIALAQGITMARLRTSPAGAAAALHRDARAAEITVAALAATIVASTQVLLRSPPGGADA